MQLAGRRRLFFALTATLAGVVATSHLTGLGTAPPGLFRDEASFAYNGWTIAHYGTDQYGTHWPLFFRSFGDYKGPVGVYLEALISTFLPMEPWAIRLPNAIAGIALAFASGWLAWRLTRSEVVFLVLAAEAAFEPWFFHLARTMLEVDLLTPLCYVVVLGLLSAGGEQRLRRCVAAGLVLGAASFTAQPARFFTPVFLLILLFAFRRSVRGSRLIALIAPVAIATVVIVAAAARTTARLSDVSVFKGHGVFGGLWLMFIDFVQYLSPWLLFLHGDGNLRHTTGVEGLFLVTAAVPVVVGVVAAFRRRSEPIATVALLAAVLAPAAASLALGVNARRDVVSMPSFLVFLAYGWEALLPRLRQRTALRVLAPLLIAFAAIPFYVDYLVSYPDRAGHDFQAGGLMAITLAHQDAGGHAIYISQYVSPDALVLFKPDPRGGDAFAAAGVHLIWKPGDADAAQPGDMIVLEAPDRPPPGSTLLFHMFAISLYRR